ncbi:hypothetical protein GCM10009757_28050 [Streptomyces cheonanensis]|uniref:Uncharacterized protein n=1 Tax=Streptomyces cheonanensis TaxID=312720 RepID=A0ABP5GPI0_9ACTN|nr:hypothetical protein [Streptomyces harbinensis]QKV70007.1 hypothetical protein HUT13_15415 [Streptomyces harbinensis]
MSRRGRPPLTGLLRHIAARLLRRHSLATDAPTIRLRLPSPTPAGDRPRPLPTLPELPDEEAMRARLRDAASPGGHDHRRTA